MCGGGGGGGGGGSVNCVSAPRIPVVPQHLGDAAPRTDVKPTPLFADDVIEKPKAKPPVVEKPRPGPLASFVKTVTEMIRPTPPIEAAPDAPPPARAKPKPTITPPTVRAEPPLPEIPAPIARRPVPV